MEIPCLWPAPLLPSDPNALHSPSLQLRDYGRTRIQTVPGTLLPFHLQMVVLTTFAATNTMFQGLSLSATEKTPAVEIKPSEGFIFITGCSIPENADRFFTPVQDVVEQYAASPHVTTTVRINLNYFNSSTSKYLLDMLKRLEDLHVSGRSNVLLEWFFQEGDLDMKEAGEDYRSLIEFPVKLKEI